MIRPKIPVLLTLAFLLAAAPASAEGQGEVRVDSIEAVSGTTSGGLVGLFIDHDTPDFPVAAHGFVLEGSDVVVTANHVQASVRSTSTQASPQPVHEGGPAVVQGVESRPDLHFWITSLDDSVATIEIQHRACTTLQPPGTSEETRRHALNGASNLVTMDARGTAQVASCTDAVAVIQGEFSITAWEWDMTVNGDRVNSGVHDATGSQGLPNSGAGSADELHIQARDAKLTIPLTPDTYELFLASPRVEAREVHLTNAEGTLPGLLERLDGANVELVGDYTLAIDPSTNPFTATVTGTTTEARAGSAALAIQAPHTPATGNPRLLFAGVAVAPLLAPVGVVRYSRPLNALRFHPDPPLDAPAKGIRGRLSAGLAIMAESDLQRGRSRQALRRARRAVRLDMENGHAVFILGGALARRENWEQAVEAYQIAHELARTDRLRCHAVMAEAEILAVTGYEEGAASLLLKARRIDAVIAADAARAQIWDNYDLQGIVARVRGGLPPGANTAYHN